MFLSQAIKRRSPPAAAITSMPGRRYRWYVLESIISKPISLRSSTVIALTVPQVPTGMNTGVETVPWGRLRVPVLAKEALSREAIVKIITMYAA
jgi:hypothetical protein